MLIIESLNIPLPPLKKPIALTIGNFDGFHLGHQAVIQAMQAPTKVLITFSNHPSEVLGRPVAKRISSISHKIKLIEQAGIDALYLIPFTRELSLQTPEEFLDRIRRSIPFDALILGADATIGKERTGTPKVLQELAHIKRFELKYVPDLLIDGKRCSSSRIRSFIERADFAALERELGRPYSLLFSHYQDLVLPPEGSYSVLINEKRGRAFIASQSLTVEPTPNRGDEIIF